MQSEHGRFSRMPYEKSTTTMQADSASKNSTGNYKQHSDNIILIIIIIILLAFLFPSRSVFSCYWDNATCKGTSKTLVRSYLIISCLLFFFFSYFLSSHPSCFLVSNNDKVCIFLDFRGYRASQQHSDSSWLSSHVICVEFLCQSRCLCFVWYIDAFLVPENVKYFVIFFTIYQDIMHFRLFV